MELKRIKIDSIIIPKNYPCCKPSQAVIDSFKRIGQVNPILVRGNRLVNGQVRIEVCKLLKRKTILAVIM